MKDKYKIKFGCFLPLGRGSDDGHLAGKLASTS